MTEPKVSVIMPSLNVGKYIRQCLDSVAAQTLRDIEIICVDAGSTDGTLEALEEYAAGDSRITVLRSDKKSYGYQMNMGIGASKGEYIGIVETDDFAEPDMFAALYEKAVSCGADIAKSDYFLFTTADGSNVKADNTAGFPLNTPISPVEHQRFLMTAPSIWSGIYKRSFLIENNIRFLETPGASYQDTGFIMKAFISAGTVILLGEAYIHYRIDNENSSVNSKGKVYAVCDEVAAVREFVSRDPRKSELFGAALWARYADAYIWNYHRLADRYRLDFCLRVRKELESVVTDQDFDHGYFTEYNWREINHMVSSPFDYFRMNREKVPEKENGKMSITQSVKNFLKRILPPPTASFMREVNELKSSVTNLERDNMALLEKLYALENQNKAILGELSRLREENKSQQSELMNKTEKPGGR